MSPSLAKKHTRPGGEGDTLKSTRVRMGGGGVTVERGAGGRMGGGGEGILKSTRVGMGKGHSRKRGRWDAGGELGGGGGGGGARDGLGKGASHHLWS